MTDELDDLKTALYAAIPTPDADRKAENIVAALEGELSFYAQVFGFELADDFAPLEITRP